MKYSLAVPTALGAFAEPRPEILTEQEFITDGKMTTVKIDENWKMVHITGYTYIYQFMNGRLVETVDWEGKPTYY